MEEKDLLAIIVFVSILIVVHWSLGVVLLKRWKQATKAGLLSSAQQRLSIIILIMFVCSVAYRLLVWGGLEQSVALFLGIPTLLSLIVVLSPKSENVTGMILRGITIALLMSGILLGEGFICILMSAPLFYLVGIIVGFFTDRSRTKGQNMNSVVILPLLFMSLEGVSPMLSFDRAETVVVEKVVVASREEIFIKLAQTPDFSKSLPSYLQLGFPRPVSTEGSGLQLGDFRQIRFAGGEGKPGDLKLRVSGICKDRVVFDAVSDTSHIAHWLNWKRSVVEVKELGNGKSLIRWTIDYDRQLDPAWYFAPWERYAVGLAAEYLIDNLAAPGSH